MNEPLSPAQIRQLPDMELSIVAKTTRAKANHLQSESAQWQRSAAWCEREIKRRRAKP